MRRLARLLFVAAQLLLLPRAFRARAAVEMRQVFDDRQREAARAGWLSVLGVWLSEFAGLLSVAWQARRPAWREADVLSAAATATSGQRVLMRGDRLRQDLRFAGRAAARRPGPYLLALFTCAVGIGASSAMFSITDTVLLRPLPYPDADRVVSVYPTIPAWRGHPTLGSVWDRASWSYPEFEDWRTEQTVFAQAAVYGTGAVALSGKGEPARIDIAAASSGLFAMLGAPPLLGRDIADADGAEGSSPVVVLTWGFWQTHFGGDRDVIGKELRLNDAPYVIVGVLPARFQLTGVDAELWLSITGSDRDNRDDHSLYMLARLAPGVTLARANQETERILRALSAKHGPGNNIVHGANVVPRLADATRKVRTPLLILMAAAVLLLVVACVNVAALLLGLGIDREQELVVRGAIGAGRGRLVAQLLTESLLLALVSGAAGVLVAWLATKALVLLAPPGVPRMGDVRLDGRVLGFAALVSALVGVAFGLVPALSLTGRSLAGRLRGARTTHTRHWLHGTLVASQLALSTILLLGAGLLLRTLLELAAVDPGFDPGGVLGVRVSPVFSQFMVGGKFDRARYDQLFARIGDALAATPGVQATAITSTLPFGGNRANNDFEAEGYAASPGELMAAERNFVSGNYMSLMRMRLIEGRLFNDSDDRIDAAPVAIITQNLARRYYPDGAVGRHFKFWAGDFLIVGVVGDVRDRQLDVGDEMRFYIPRGERPGQGGSFVLRLESGVRAAALTPLLRERIWSVDPDVPITSIVPLTERIADSLVEQRYRARLMGVFAALSVLFAFLGIYGVTSRSVASRRREIGIRMALGERKTSVMGLVIGQGVRLAVSGVMIGLLGGAASSRVLRAFLYGTSPLDPLTLALVGASLTTLAVLASFAPSLRAASVDPMTALRMD